MVVDSVFIYRDKLGQLVTDYGPLAFVNGGTFKLFCIIKSHEDGTITQEFINNGTK